MRCILGVKERVCAILFERGMCVLLGGILK